MTLNHQPKPALRVPANPSQRETLDLRSGAAFACAVFTAAYWLFRWCQPWIVASPTPVPAAEIAAWARWAALEQDGREVPFAFVGVLACIALCFEVARRAPARRVLSFRLLRWACYCAAATVILGIRSSEFSFDAHTAEPLVVVAVLLLALTWRAPGVLSRRWFRVTMTTCFAVGAAAVVLFTSGNPTIGDYGYLIGPALKWLDGEPLGTFYMQYSLLSTLITAALMRLGLHINAMQLALTVVSIAWLALYGWLARELIRDRGMRALFLVVLFAFRVLWMQHQIAMTPQVAPFRMELWLPPVLVARKLGLLSPWTACSFAAIYALDGLFGFLYLGAYLGSAAFELGDSHRRGEARIRPVLVILAPAALAGIFNLAVFGSLVAQSATRYMDVRLGFLPISPSSLFWLVLLILLMAVVVFARATRERAFGMFLVMIATVQMTYFLGRSHDHNLINIAGSWLLVTFVTLDTVVQQSPRFARATAAVLLIAVFGLGSQRIASVVQLAGHRMLHGDWYREHEIDRELDSLHEKLPRNTPNVILLDVNDAYINYRLGLRQHGFYSPVAAHIFNEETAGWLYEEIARGERVLFVASGPMALNAARAMVGDLNRTRFITERAAGFSLASTASSISFELTFRR